MNIYKFFLLTWILFSSISYAGTTIIYQDLNYVYYRTPAYRMNQKSEGQIRKIAFQKIKGFLEQRKDVLKKDPYSSDPDDLEVLEKLQSETDQYLKRLHEFLYSNSSQAFSEGSLIPSAYLVSLGITLPKNILDKLIDPGDDEKGNSNLSFQLAMIMMPVQYTILNKRTGAIKVKYKVEMSPTLFSYYQFGNKKESLERLSKFKLGGGFIWGALETPRNFTGASVGMARTGSFLDFSKYFKLNFLKDLMGKFGSTKYQLQMGALKQWNHEQSSFNGPLNPYTILSVSGSKSNWQTQTKFNVGISVSVESMVRALTRTMFGSVAEDGFYVEPGDMNDGSGTGGVGSGTSGGDHTPVFPTDWYKINRKNKF